MLIPICKFQKPNEFRKQSYGLKLFLLGASVLSFATSCQRSVEPDFLERSYIHEYGLPVESDHWIRYGSSGQILTTQHDGVICTQTYANGMLDGESSYTFPDSPQIHRVETYANDFLTKETIFHLNGVSQQTIEYQGPQGRTITTWYDSGLPKSIEKYEASHLIQGEYFTSQNEKDSWVHNGFGERASRDNEGNFVSLDTFENGNLTSKTYYHPNGAPREITPYANDVIHGQRKTYYPGGEPMTIEAWDNGQQTGVTVVFQDGEKHAEVPYLGGKKNGVERRYRDGAIVTQEVTWKDDQMHGPTYTYGGDNIQTDWFYKGRLTSRSNYESFAVPRPPKNCGKTAEICEPSQTSSIRFENSPDIGSQR